MLYGNRGKSQGKRVETIEVQDNSELNDRYLLQANICKKRIKFAGYRKTVG
jgi:hypothetical protein